MPDAPNEAAIRAAVRAELDVRDRDAARRKAQGAQEMWPFLAFAFALAVWVVPWMCLGWAIEAAAGVSLRRGWPYAAWVAALVAPPMIAAWRARRGGTGTSDAG